MNVRAVRSAKAGRLLTLAHTKGKVSSRLGRKRSGVGSISIGPKRLGKGRMSLRGGITSIRGWGGEIGSAGREESLKKRLTAGRSEAPAEEGKFALISGLNGGVVWIGSWANCEKGE